MRVHFVGIGGIGVSALAKYYLENGYEVSGSDLTSSEITESLKKQGVKIRIGRHNAESLPEGADPVVYSPAVSRDNPELSEAKKRGYKILSYPEALGVLTKKYFTIAVSGTHGKSTTAAMTGLLLSKAGLDPTVIIGTKLKEFGDSNCRVGKSRYLVIEADEHMASFLNYWPQIIVLTNIEKDHLDYYKNLNNIVKTFKKYIRHLPRDGYLVINGGDKNTKKIISGFKSPILKYRLSRSGDSSKLKNILKIPGEHNVLNALAALAVARILKIPDEVSFGALSEYSGSWRRFDVKNITLNEKRITLVNDYGHHPTEVRVTLKAIREKWQKEKIWCVFQPHQYQRTYYLFKDFVEVFSRAPVDKLVITDIYGVAGREDEALSKKVSSKKLAESVKKSRSRKKPETFHISSLAETADFIGKNIMDGEILVIMGAGDIYGLDGLLKNSGLAKK